MEIEMVLRRRTQNADLSDDVSAEALAKEEALGVSDDEAKSERPAARRAKET